MNKTIIKAPAVTMEKMNSLFIEMTAQNCSLRCKHCYIKFNDKKIKDFIPADTIKQSLNTINKEDLEYIHLTGAEPMLHPDFNNILRLCLKYSNVIIHTNALNINDKKARFLKKVEEENNSENEIIFMISIDHYNEKINDEIRGRGSFRKAIHAIQSLIKYDFNPILSIVNHYNIPENELKNDFKELCNSINFETSDINFKIIPLMQADKEIEIKEGNNIKEFKAECSCSRTLTINGVFTCPILSSDNRGKSGTDFNNYSKKNYLETPYCTQCLNNSGSLFMIDM